VSFLSFAERFGTWVEDSRLEEKTKKFYRNGWRLLKATAVGDFAEQLKFPGSAANANCALRTLRRMLHKAEEWKVIVHALNTKMMKERGRHLCLDEEAERKLTMGGLACWESGADAARSFVTERCRWPWPD
jgi:hypothetical protein